MSHTSVMPGPIVADFEEFLKLVKIQHLSNQDCIKAFLSYVNHHDKCRDEWLKKENDLLEQVKTVSKEKEKLEKRCKLEMDSLEKKLKVAQRLIDLEKSHRTRIEEEKLNMECQLQEIRNLLQDNRNKLHDETREKLQYLSSMDQRLSTINESMYQDHTGSCLSDLSYSRSEDDIIDVDSTRFTRKQRRSRGVTTASDEIVGVNAKRRRSAMNTARSDIVRAGPGECLVATTRVDLGNRGEPVASSVIETFPSVTSVIPPLKPAKPSAPQMSTDSGESEADDIRNINLRGIDRTPSNTALRSPSGNSLFPFGMNMINSRTHSLVSKTIIRPEFCDLCSKKIKFGRVSLRCVDCKTVCHVECKDKLKPPCIPPGSGTPNGKDSFGVISDYAPPTAPMVPAIVVHCINEIEERGLSETGLYRVPGSDVEVKSLRDRFLKGKGSPNLSLISDVHVITGCLKSFLRSLHEPLATYSQRPNFVHAIQNHNDEEARRAALYQNFTELPQANRDTLAFLILHLQRVAEVPECRMPVKSLAKIMGPTVIGYSRPDLEKIKMDVFLESQQSVEIMEELLSIPSEYWKNFLFHSTPAMPCTPSTTSLRDQRGFFESPSPGWYTVRKKKK